MTLFDLVVKKDNAGLADALAEDPGAASTRNADGASLLAFAVYAGNTDAIPVIRAHLPAIYPHEAIILGDMLALEAALVAGWDGNSFSSDGFPPLALAAFFRRKEAFDRLLPLTRDVNAPATNAQHVAALHAAATISGVAPVELLLRAGADPNLPQQQGFVPLHTAAANGSAAVAGLLVLFGADPERRNDAGQSPAGLAREKGHDWLAERLDGAAAGRSATQGGKKKRGP